MTATYEDVSTVFAAEPGYDLASAWYDRWHWTEFWQRNELPITCPLLDSFPQGRALDAGSGTGVYRFALRARGHDVVAIDISQKMLDIQATKGGASHGELVQGDIRSIPADWRETFDTVVCARALSHIDDCQLAIGKLGEVLRPGGRMILTDVDSEHPYTHVTVKNGVVHSRIRAFKHTHGEISAALRQAGVSVISMRRYALSSLIWKPNPHRFKQIYSAPERSVFFVYYLMKR